MRRRTAASFAELGVGRCRTWRVPGRLVLRRSTPVGGHRPGGDVGQDVVILLDEPTAALGVIQTAKVLELIRRVRDRGLAVIFISHNMPQVLEVRTASRCCGSGPGWRGSNRARPTWTC